MNPATYALRDASARVRAPAGTRPGIGAGDTSYCSDRATSSLGAPVPDVQFLAYPAVRLRLPTKSWMIAE